MKVYASITLMAVFLLFACKDNPTEGNDSATTYIEVIDLIPQTGSTISASDTIAAVLKYAIDNAVQSDYGFSISVKFASVNEGQTFSIGQDAEIVLTEKTGTVTHAYPLDLIWNHADLKHPVSCYFYLHRKTSQTSSTVIAKTAEIKYTE